MEKLQLRWDQVRSSLWFVPSLIVSAAILLAALLIEAESYLGMEQLAQSWPRLFGSGAAGSRGMLSAIAGSMITVAGVTFSITVVALALASSQYTSRILRNFMRDRASQAVLGVFVGVFAYCLIVLRTIRGGDEGTFVPAIAVFVAVLLALVAIGFLIFFIHHISASIQASSIIESAAAETLDAVDRLFPAGVGQTAFEDPRRGDEVESALGPFVAVPARKTGYIQAVNADDLFKVARELAAVIRMERGVGEFVIEGSPIVSVAGAQPDEESIRKANAAYGVGRYRTVEQDAGFGIRQIVDVALKALSPGINDTTTAVNCIDYLGAILARLARRRIEVPHRSDNGRLRLIARGPTFATLLDESFDQIRQNADGNVAVLVRMLEVVQLITVRTSDESRLQSLRRQADLVLENAQRSVPSEHDRARILAAARLATALITARP